MDKYSPGLDDISDEDASEDTFPMEEDEEEAAANLGNKGAGYNVDHANNVQSEKYASEAEDNDQNDEDSTDEEDEEEEYDGGQGDEHPGHGVHQGDDNYPMSEHHTLLPSVEEKNDHATYIMYFICDVLQGIFHSSF